MSRLLKHTNLYHTLITLIPAEEMIEKNSQGVKIFLKYRQSCNCEREFFKRIFVLIHHTCQ